MDPLPLEADSDAGTYKLVGGRPSLDLVNTVSWRGTERSHDWLDRASNVIRWARALELVDEVRASQLAEATAEDPDGAERALFRIHRHREVLYRVLNPLGHQARPAPADVETLNETLVLCDRFRTIHPDRLEWSWERPRRLDEVIRPVVADAADVLVHADRARLGHCPACGWLYYDSTRGRSRRWCDMADCGSRDKARRYYRRKVAAASG